MKLKFAFLALLVGFVAAEEVVEKENLAMVCGNSCNVRICCAINTNRKVNDELHTNLDGNFRMDVPSAASATSFGESASL